MKRFLSILAAVSVLPAVVAIATWVLGLLGTATSFWVPVAEISVMVVPSDPVAGVGGGGTIMLLLVSDEPFPGWRPPLERRVGPQYMWNHAGVRCMRSYVGAGGVNQQYQPAMMVLIKTWLPVLLFVPPPASYYAIRVHRWRRARALQMVGKCQRCGYDLRATPERCPECGEVVSARP